MIDREAKKEVPFQILWIFYLPKYEVLWDLFSKASLYIFRSVSSIEIIDQSQFEMDKMNLN